MADKEKLRTLKIKTGVVRRYTKEKIGYEKEVEDQKKKIEKFEAEGKEEYFLRQQVQCLKESELMIPDTQRRLLTSFGELKNIVGSELDEKFTKTEEYKNAVQILAEAEAHLPTDN